MRVLAMKFGIELLARIRRNRTESISTIVAWRLSLISLSSWLRRTPAEEEEQVDNVISDR